MNEASYKKDNIKTHFDLNLLRKWHLFKYYPFDTFQYIYKYIIMEIKTYRHTDNHTNRHTDIRTYWYSDIQTYGQTDTQAYGPTYIKKTSPMD